MTNSEQTPIIDDPCVIENSTKQLIREFIGSKADYYIHQFTKIGEASGFRVTFNVMAALFGPLWYGMRNLWNWVLPFMILEVIALIPLSRGLWSDLAADEKIRAEGIARILAERQEQAAEAIKTGAANTESLVRAAKSLEKALQDSLAQAEAITGNATTLVITGIVLLIVFKLIQGLLANWLLEKRFTRWRSDKDLTSTLNIGSALTVTVLTGLVYVVTIIRFTVDKPAQFLLTFPTDKVYHLTVAETIKAWFGRMTIRWDHIFDGITMAVRSLLDSLELLFLGTPWLVVMPVVVLLAWRAAGPRVAIFTSAALLYLGFMGFWANAMSTVALLGAAACISITVGIPVGVLCARNPKIFFFVRPILDFMQTMPSFVYLIPVIAFFGTGKPAGIIATLVFGSPPVIRMTVLGLQGVPESVREAAIAFGATPRYILFKVDLPLAAPSIMAGINQTIMLSLSMVVIASLIGAKGLGEEVLEALQYASEGQGILAGLAILFCAMILDRVVQGKGRK